MKRTIDNISWYRDESAGNAGEPGIVHSYAASLATAINHIEGELDPVTFIGATGFAFRLWINKTMCPSAMSVFDFDRVLPEAIRQCGYECKYITRLWDEGALEAERRNEAHAAMVEAIDDNRPAIVWDVFEAEWGLAIGYDDDSGVYKAMTNAGEHRDLPYEKLGNNGINILSVAIPMQRNSRDRAEIIKRALRIAIDHADQKEWCDRPEYQDGLPAWQLWSQMFEFWSLLVESGRVTNATPDLPNFAKYYADHYFSARRYARDFFGALAKDDPYCAKLSDGYADVAEILGTIWMELKDAQTPSFDSLMIMSKECLRAHEIESGCIELMRGMV